MVNDVGRLFAVEKVEIGDRWFSWERGTYLIPGRRIKVSSLCIVLNSIEIFAHNGLAMFGSLARIQIGFVYF